MKRLIVALLLFSIAPFFVSAYVPGFVSKEGVVVNEPLRANRFFGELHEESAVFRFSLKEGGIIYLNLMTPVSVDGGGKFDAVIVNESAGTVTAVLEAGALAWQSYRDTSIGEDFLRGPELNMTVPAGEYRIVVTSQGNIGKFVLQIGQDESFSIGDYFALYKMGPTLKRVFFDSARFSFFTSIVGFSFTLLFVLLGMLLGYGVGRSTHAVDLWKRLWGRSAGIPLFQLVCAAVSAMVSLILLVLSLLIFWNIALFVCAGFFALFAFRVAYKVVQTIRTD